MKIIQCLADIETVVHLSRLPEDQVIKHQKRIVETVSNPVGKCSLHVKVANMLSETGITLALLFSLD